MNHEEITKQNFDLVKVKESDTTKTYTFRGASTLPDRVREVLPDGRIIYGEILDKKVLDKISMFINDTSKIGGKNGSYRTISLFHNRVREKNPHLEEAGYTLPTAKVVPLEGHPGHWALEVDVEVNDMFVPPDNYADYTPEKIHYKIEKKALGLSIEYNNEPHQEELTTLDGKLYRLIKDTDDFRGFGFARPDLLGNPTAVRIKETNNVQQEEEKNMNEEQVKQLESQIEAANAKLKELDAKVKENASEELATQLTAQKAEVDAKLKELAVAKDDMAVKIKEAFDKFSASIKTPQVNAAPANANKDAKLKEMAHILDNPRDASYGSAKFKEFDWQTYNELARAKVKEQEQYIKDQMIGNGFNFNTNKTVEVKCKGRTFVVEPTAKTKDVINNSSMAESTYLQTNAFYADMYTAGITETFLMEDSLLKTLVKEPHVRANDKYQWKIWVDFGSFDGDNTAAVDPDQTSVNRTKREFIKLETPIREYRDGVEVTDFTQYHSVVSIGDLMGEEIQRAAEFVVNSMNADLYKGKTDATAGWKGFVGLIGIADSSTHASLYGKTRTAGNRLLDSVLANTFDSTAEAISVAVVRKGYEKVLAQGSSLNDIAIVMHPTQVMKLFNANDNNISGTANATSTIEHPVTISAAPPEFGFKRALIPHIDGIPIIRDYRCESVLGDQDMFAVLDLNPRKGAVLVVSKPLDVRGLAKVGTTESAYVSFYGAFVYKSPRNIFVHEDLTI